MTNIREKRFVNFNAQINGVDICWMCSQSVDPGFVETEFGASELGEEAVKRFHSAIKVYSMQILIYQPGPTYFHISLSPIDLSPQQAHPQDHKCPLLSPAVRLKLVL